MRTVVGRAPVRIDLAGGTLDLWPIPFTLPDTTTVNVALDLPAVVEVTRGPAWDAPGPDPSNPASGTQVILESRAHPRPVGPPATAARVVLPDATVDPETVPDAVRLLYRAVAATMPEGGVHVVATTASPVGAGLGGSSTLLACAVATLAHAAGRPRQPAEIARVAQDLETAHLRAPTGYQDYYPALFGGCLALTARPGHIEVERLPVSLPALARRLRLVYTGVPHHSGWTNWHTLRSYLDGEPRTVAAMRAIADRARAVRSALRAGALNDALHLVVEEGHARTELSPGVVTREIAAVDAAARAAGALGTKVCGAGGGGCVLIVLRDDTEPPGLASALQETGSVILPLRLVEQGVTPAERSASETG